MVNFEHYPAAAQSTQLALPFPTFQYRGRILRADDQDGARLYLFKRDRFWVQLTGNGYPPLVSNRNRARRGMANLPVNAQGGPRASVQLAENWLVHIGLFPAFLLDLRHQRSAGGTLRTQLQYDFEIFQTDGEIKYTLEWATQEFQHVYFGVPWRYAAPDRPRYAAKSGFLAQEVSYFQRLRHKRASFYLGLSVSDYSMNANSESPLHRRDLNLTGLIGMTYTLSESKKASVPESETDGVIKKVPATFL